MEADLGTSIVMFLAILCVWTHSFKAYNKQSSDMKVLSQNVLRKAKEMHGYSNLLFQGFSPELEDMLLIDFLHPKKALTTVHRS